MHVLRPLFILDPWVSFAAADIATLAGLVLGAARASASVAIVVLRRLNPTEVLREQ
jgi:hypothetical protein